MSASDKKRLKKAAMAEGMTQKQRMEAEAAQAAKRKKTIYWAVGIICAVATVALLIWNNLGGVMDRLNYNKVAATVDGTDYTVGDLQYYYGEARQQIYQFQNTYGFSMGFSTLLSDGAQWYDESAGKTWADYFRETAMTNLKQVSALCSAANEAGYTLSEEGQASIDEYMHQIDTYRAQYGLTRDAYLAQIYGDSVTEKVFLRNLAASTLATEYSQYHKDNISYDDAALDAYYKAHPDSLDSYDYRIFTISGSPAAKTDSDGKTVDPTDAEKEAAKSKAKSDAEAAVKEIEEAEDREKAFIAAAPKYVSESTQEAYSRDESYSLMSGVLGSNLSSSAAYASSWLMDAGRKAGDVTYVEAGNNYQVVLFLKRYLVTDPTVDMRHILIRPETSDEDQTNENGAAVPSQAEMDAAKAELQTILDEWKAGEATEESFAALAEEHSDDGRNSDGSLYASGGLYDHVSEGDMIPGINEWLFASGRKPGDVEMIEYNEENGRYYGWHLVYYVQENEPIWKDSARKAKQSTDQSEWLTALTDAVEATTADGMQYVGSTNTAVPTATPSPVSSEQPSESEEPSASPAQ